MKRLSLPRTLTTGDLHLSANPRDAYRFVFLEKTLPGLVREHMVERVIILGDLTEAKDGHGAELTNRLVDGIAALTTGGVVVYILKANHDYLAEDVPFFRFLRHVPRVRWINSPTRLRLRGLGACWFLPHSPRWSDEWAELDLSDTDWFFCHQTFGGANLDHGHKAVGGAPPFTRKAGDQVISGDVHVPQQLGAITYVGAPYTIDFGDSYEPRVLLLEGDNMHSIPVEGPQKRLVVLRNRADRYPNVQPGDVVKVRIEPPPGNEVPKAEWRAQVRRWADAAGVQLYATEVIAPKASSVAKSANRTRDRSSDDGLVRAYAKRMKRGKATIAAGLKLMGEVA